MARHGTATIGALSGYGNNTTGELKILRALHALDRKPLDIVATLCHMGANDEINLDLLQCAVRRKLAHVAAVRSGEGGRPHHRAPGPI